MGNEMLDNLTRQRHLLQKKIRGFTALPPNALRIEVNGQPIIFPIDAMTGKVGELPKVGVWGWARNLFWLDLKIFLEEREYRVVEVEFN
jgi:hypothetical protein